MNNIDILEEKEKKAYDNLIMLKYFTMEKEDKESIDIILKLVETLIAEYKELKEKNDRKSQEIWKYQKTLENLQKKTVWKSKVEELKDKIHRELEINAVTRRDLIYVDLNLARIDQYFNELLGKE